MSEYRVAVRYAKSLLELSEERNKLEEVKDDFMNFDSLCQSNRDFLNFLRNPIIPNLQKWGILKKIFQGKVCTETLAFLEIITRKNRETILQDITKVFLELYRERKGIVNAQVITAVPIDEQLKDEFTKIVKSIASKSKEVILEEEIDESILGGYKLRVGDKQMDGTISAQLKKLKRKLII